MALNYQEADRLFRKGDFSELVRLAGSKGSVELEAEPRVRVVIAHAFAVTGNLKAATISQHLTHLRSPPLPYARELNRSSVS